MADKIAKSRALIDLATSPEINRKTTLGEVAAAIDAADLAEMYEALMGSAPRRHTRDKRYFVGLGDVDVAMGSAGSKPQLLGATAHTMLHRSRRGKLRSTSTPQTQRA